jgi:hypothetical protein
MTKADSRKQRRAAVIYPWLSKEETLRTEVLVFLAV